jgi:hypothetical protein
MQATINLLMGIIILFYRCLSIPQEGSFHAGTVHLLFTLHKLTTIVTLDRSSFVRMTLADAMISCPSLSHGKTRFAWHYSSSSPNTPPSFDPHIPLQLISVVVGTRPFP